MVIHVMQHVADKETIEDIREIGLIVNDPTDRWRGDIGNPPGVYLTKGFDNPYIEFFKDCVARGRKFEEEEILTINVAGLPLKLDRNSTRCRDCYKYVGQGCYCRSPTLFEFYGDMFCCSVDIEPERIM